MSREIRAAAPDVVHAHWTYEFALAALKSRLPSVVTVRDAPVSVLRYEPDLYRLGRFMMALMFRLRARPKWVSIAAVSPYMAGEWRREMRDGRRVRVLPNIPLLEGGAGRQGLAKSSSPRIVELASANPRKNVWVLLEAFHLVRQTVPDAELHLIGHGLGVDEDISSAAKRAGFDSGVAFMGHVSRDRTLAELGGAWVHAHVSLEESFGNTLIEAMSVGTAVVAGATSGAAPWVLGEGEGGRLVDVSNPAEVADALIELLGDSDRRQALIDGGHRVLRDRHAVDGVMQSHIDAYEESLEIASRASRHRRAGWES